MLFNSLSFIVFLVVIFATYWTLNRAALRWQNLLVLVGSYVFYGWWDWRFLSLIFLSSIIDFTVGLNMSKATVPSRRKTLLIVSLVVNLGLLGFFKYYNFFLDSFIAAFDTLGVSLQPSTLKIILPVGISFYTFQTMSYTIDLYRKKIDACTNPIQFFAFVSFFPQLVAGPIERASNLLPQFATKRIFTFNQARDGLQLMLWGMFKKVVIADRIGEYVDIVYSAPSEFVGVPIIAATFLFAIQIYCDFSGYSDIAIGTAKLFGFDLMTNFKTPYFSTSIREFWSRWHISLSTWFRDYVYIPLGGNRGTTTNWLSNLMITFVVSGFWHGANWTFILWGAIHGVANMVEAYFRKFVSINVKVPNLVKGLWIFFIVCVAWIFFRADSIGDAFLILENSTKGIGSQLADKNAIVSMIKSFIPYGRDLQYLIVTFLLFIGVEMYLGKGDFNVKFNRIPRLGKWSLYYIIAICILLFGAFNRSDQFIYFQF